MSNTGHKYISQTQNGYVFTVPAALAYGQQTVSRTSLDVLVEERNKILGYDPDNGNVIERPGVEIEVPAPRRIWTTEELWANALAVQERMERVPVVTWYPVKIKETKPIALVLMSDIHFGSPYTNYRQVREDTDIIIHTPGMYMEWHGDERDNWIAGKLTAIQRQQEMTFDSEIRMYKSWLDSIKEKLLVFVTGNHDLWTHKQSGLDLASLLLPDNVLYHKYEVLWELRLEEAAWRFKTRHEWAGNSIYNPTHGIETSWERAGHDFDIGVGGHTHIATLCREFIREDKKRYAVLTGTYKNLGDPFGKELGNAPSHGRGSGAFIFWPDGRSIWIEDLKTAREFLTWARG